MHKQSAMYRKFAFNVLHTHIHCGVAHVLIQRPLDRQLTIEILISE